MDTHTKHEQGKLVAWLKTRHNQLSENASSVFFVNRKFTSSQRKRWETNRIKKIACASQYMCM